MPGMKLGLKYNSGESHYYLLPRSLDGPNVDRFAGEPQTRKRDH